MLGAGGTGTLPNDDTHLLVEYFTVAGSVTTLCGHYGAAGAAFVAEPGFSQATCLGAGSLVRVTVNNSYPVLTRQFAAQFGAGISLSAAITMVELR